MEGSKLKRKAETADYNQSFAEKIKNYIRLPSSRGVSFLGLYKYTTTRQKLFVLIGILAAVINGAPMPIMLVVYGSTTDQFVSTHFCSAYDWYNVSLLCPPEVTPENINQLYLLCDWNGTNITLPELVDNVSRDAVYFVIIGVAVWILSWIQMTLMAYACEQIILDMRVRLFSSILSKPMSWYDTHDAGSINNYFTDLMNKYKQGIGDKVSMIVQSAVLTIAAVVLIFTLDWKTSLVVLSLSPLFVISASFMTLATMGSSESESRAHDKASSVAQQTFANIRTVHAFNGHEIVQLKYESHLDFARKKAVKKGVLNGSMLSLLWLVLFSSNALAFWYGEKRLSDGVTVGDILIVIFGMQMAVFSLGGSLPHFHAISEGRMAAANLYKLIQDKVDLKKGRYVAALFNEGQSADNELEEPVISQKSTSTLDPAKTRLGKVESIRFEGVSFAYPSRPDVIVLNDVTFEISKGQTVAVVGESGSGKSTIAQLILGFYNLNSGVIYINNIPLHKIDLHELRSGIGMVSQEPSLFSTTIAENIRLGKPNATDDEIANACKMANASDFINQFPHKYETKVGESGSQLSGGQKQRIAIARALISDPSILLLDEATSALDSEGEKVVQAALDVASQGRTTLIIAHRLSTIRNADIIIGMKRGRVVEIGTHDELMKQGGVYSALVNAQTHKVEEVESDSEVFDDIVRTKPSKLEKSRSRLTSVWSQAGFDVVDQQSEELSSKNVLPYLLKMNMPEMFFIVMGCISCVAFGVTQILFEIFFARILFVYAYCDEIERGRRISRDSLTFLWIGIGSAVAQALSSGSFTFSGEQLTKRLRRKVFQSLVKQDIAFFDNDDNSVGRLCTMLSAEASAVQGATGIRIGTILSGLSILLLGVIIAFIVGWQLSLVILAFVPLMIFSGMLSIRVMAGFDAGDKEYLEKASLSIIESTSSIRIVKQLRQEGYFLRKYEENVQFVCKRNTKRTIVTGFLFGLSQGIVFFAVAATYYAGAQFVSRGYMTSEDMMLVFGTLLFGAMAVGNSQAMAPDFGKAFSAAKIVYSILHKKPNIDSTSDDGIIPSVFNGSFSLNKIRFFYPNRTDAKVLKGVNMRITSKEKVALVGTSGCGKSTIIQLLQRFYDPTGGSITLDGRDIRTLNLKWYRRQLGIVSQEPVLFDWSIAENIAFGDTSRLVTMEEIQDAARAANIHDFVAQLPQGYDTPVGAKGSLISGGQKQRICLARALVRDPQMLLLDEATSALDTESEKHVQKALDEATVNRSTIAIAHRLSTIKNSDQIYVFNDGIIVEEGTHDNLIFGKGLYASIYQLSQR